MKGRIAGDGRPGEEYEYEVKEVTLKRGNLYIWKRELPVVTMPILRHDHRGRILEKRNSFYPASFVLEEVKFTGRYDGKCVVIPTSGTDPVQVDESELICSVKDFNTLPRILKDNVVIGVTREQVVPLSVPMGKLSIESAPYASAQN